ncbi:MAG TPA: serine/threonine-protein kinase [Gemmataceae bacterium]|nr:serine/threonine-protein kinase [Gemmataceae bacterium]
MNVATVDFGDSVKTSRKPRCRFAQGSDSGPCFTDEMTSLLRTRLRLAILIILVGFTLHFVRNVLLQEPAFDHRPLRLSITGGEIAVMALVSVLLWSRRLLSMKTLRTLELTIFGMVAVFFAWLQFDAYHDGVLRGAIVPGGESAIYRQIGMAGILRSFLLIVLYGVFIPNTGRRCAAVVAVLAAVPLGLLIVDGLVEGTAAPYLWSALPEAVILIGTAATIAVFGSHKIREMQQKAHEAQRLGQYRLKRVVGFGGMGAVYLAEHVMLRRPCAVKLIRPDQAGDPRTLLRFEREVRATATLTHPNTVEIFDYGHAEDGTFYYVMEYLPGMNLEELVEQHGPMPPERAVHLLRQVCQALREAHGIGLIHRDVKPSNIFACERGKVYDVAKLLDFGLVKGFGLEGDDGRLTRDGALTGSPAFVSPEQAKGRAQLDARSDIYNVGAVAYFLLTGQLLFDRSSALEMLHAHAYEPPTPIPQFQQTAAADLQGVVLRCLEKDPDRRYPDAASLDRALAACACAGQWTPERAEDWWQRNADADKAAPATDEFERDGQNVPATR